jgi:hypothetical protein
MWLNNIKGLQGTFSVKFRLVGDGSRESIFAPLAALTLAPTTTNLID